MSQLNYVSIYKLGEGMTDKVSGDEMLLFLLSSSLQYYDSVVWSWDTLTHDAGSQWKVRPE